jgi:hypothetical protein
MQYEDLPCPPTEYQFLFESKTVEELCTIMDITRTTFYKILKKVSPHLGARPTRKFNGEQVLIILWAYQGIPTGYFQPLFWLEKNGWKKFLIEKYEVQHILYRK